MSPLRDDAVVDYEDEQVAVIRHDARQLPLEDESVDLIVTSPPYFVARSYRDKCPDCDGGELVSRVSSKSTLAGNGHTGGVGKKGPNKIWQTPRPGAKAVGGDCETCDGSGQVHYAGQIGSEDTPDLFLDALDECMTEWGRVLKPSGSVWINLGDSYAGSGGYNNSNIGAGGKGPASYEWSKRGAPPDIEKAQWTEADAAWLAGVIDSDGSISVHINNPRKPHHQPSYVPWVRIGQMRPEAVAEARRITGTGTLFEDKRGVYNWRASSQQARYVLERIWPWLRLKQRQALAAVELARHIADTGASGKRPVTDDETHYRATIREAVLAWNEGKDVLWQPPRLPKLTMPRHLEWPARQKSLNGLPWRFAIRQIDNGWILRAEVVWDKPNGLPESVTDRVRRSHETWFHMVKEPRYFSGVDEIREPHLDTGWIGRDATVDLKRNSDRNDAGDRATSANPLGRLPGSVWTIPSEPLLIPDDTRQALDLPDHFAAFPQEWPRRIILGWSPTGICTVCGEGRRPVASKEAFGERLKRNRRHIPGYEDPAGEGQRDVRYTIDSYACACPTHDAPTTPAVVLDPMGGTGTVAGVARMLGRYGISNDLSASYNRLAIWRITQSGHFTKTEQRSWADRQGQLL